MNKLRTILFKPYDHIETTKFAVRDDVVRKLDYMQSDDLDFSPQSEW